MLAISVDSPEESRAVVTKDKLPFSILSDPEARTIRDYGVLHERAAPNGADMAVPAQFLVSRDGSIAWHYVSRKIQERSNPAATLEAVTKLAP